MKVTLIQIDETEYWELDSLPHGEYVEQMLGTYLFETDVDTYCCSATPMKFMKWLRNESIMSEAFYEEVDDPDIARDELWQEVLEAPGDDIYLKRSFITRYADDHPDRVFVDDKEHDDWDDAIMSHSESWML